MPPPNITSAISTISNEDYPAIQGVNDWTHASLGGVGISGVSKNGIGVLGKSTGGNGVVGTTRSDHHAGVLGQGTMGPGVHGTSKGKSAPGVVGENLRTGPGVLGKSTSADGTGVHAQNTGGGQGLYAQGTPAGRFEGDMNVTGNVGIGIDTPGFKLDVADRIRVREGTNSAGVWFFQQVPQQDQAFVGMDGDNSVGFFGNTGAGWGLTMDTTTGNVGIGTDTPGFKFDVADRIRVREGADSAGVWFFQQVPQQDQAFVGMDGDNSVGFFGNTGAGWGLTMDTSTGDINIPTGNINLVQGDIFLGGADCAEQFDIANGQQLEPGTVVILDEEGALRESCASYDKKVAGVVSGAGNYRPGIILDKRASEEGRAPVALVGKVYCKVDAQTGPIEVGDLLTTSSRPGYAMKAADPLKAFGAVIGKALRSLKEGQAMIPILIALR
ncbi:MAG: hypothetical protein DMG65_13480 [Candidatus Angelobacter sp. Gp1-AA117]|nr:MAG: hypothetical protein DMG65_13480 [Candidatus Angelobacter sp. Gp1-AA117]